AQLVLLDGVGDRAGTNADAIAAIIAHLDRGDQAVGRGRVAAPQPAAVAAVARNLVLHYFVAALLDQQYAVARVVPDTVAAHFDVGSLFAEHDALVVILNRIVAQRDVRGQVDDDADTAAALLVATDPVVLHIPLAALTNVDADLAVVQRGRALAADDVVVDLCE